MSLSLPISNFTAERAELVNGAFIFHGVKVEFSISEAPVAETFGKNSAEPEDTSVEGTEEDPEADADISGLCTLIGDLTLGQGDKRARDSEDTSAPPEDGTAELKRSKR